jgi:hypothetical protein
MSLYIVFWNTDKSSYQLFCAKKITELFEKVKDKEIFLLSCIEVFNTKWSKIDFLRIDKYFMLMDQIYACFFNKCLEKQRFKVIIKEFTLLYNIFH